MNLLAMFARFSPMISTVADEDDGQNESQESGK